MNGFPAGTTIEQIINSPHYVKMRKREKDRKERENHLKSENLDSLAQEALSYHTRIFIQNKRGIRDSDKLDELYQLSAETEDALWRRIFNGESLSRVLASSDTSLLEYVLINFHRSRSSDVSLMNQPSRIAYSPSAFSYLSRIKDFFEDIKKLEGEQYVLTHHSSKWRDVNDFQFSFADKGKIAGAPKIEGKVLGKFHHKLLIVPVIDRYQYNNQSGIWVPNMGDALVLDNNLIKNRDEVLRIKGTPLPKGIELRCKHGPYIGGTTAYTQISFSVGNKRVQPIVNEIDNNIL